MTKQNDDPLSAPTPFGDQFRGKHVLVTGASSGIGLAVAQGFAQAGAQLTILAENDGINAAANDLARDGRARPRVIQCSVADHASVAEQISLLPDIHILAHVAGVQPKTPILSEDPRVDDIFTNCMNINVLGTWYVVREVIKKMPDHGRIILTSSNWAETGVAEYAGYVASKNAVIGLAKSLAVELGHKGITVNAVCPGWVNTEGAMWTVRETAEAEGKTLDDYVVEQTTTYALPGIMQPEAMQGIYQFLASDLAQDVTGQAWNVDRGGGLGFR